MKKIQKIKFKDSCDCEHKEKGIYYKGKRVYMPDIVDIQNKKINEIIDRLNKEK